MAETVITPEALGHAYVADDRDWLVEEEADCPTCGEQMEVGQQFLEVYAPESMSIGKHRAVWTVHLRCYQGETVAE